MQLPTAIWLNKIVFFFLLQRLNPPILLFVQNIERAKQLYNVLKYEDVRADIMHADLSQMQVVYNYITLMQDHSKITSLMQLNTKHIWCN